MPDLQQFSLTAQADASLTVARLTISGQVTDSATGAVLVDFTGANAVVFALRVPGFSAAEHRQLAALVGQRILMYKAGLGTLGG